MGELLTFPDRASRPIGVGFKATTVGQVVLELELEGRVVPVTLSIEAARTLLLQGTDAVELAERIARG